jgi:hypothetical protein
LCLFYPCYPWFFFHTFLDQLADGLELRMAGAADPLKNAHFTGGQNRARSLQAAQGDFLIDPVARTHGSLSANSGTVAPRPREYCSVHWIGRFKRRGASRIIGTSFSCTSMTSKPVSAADICVACAMAHSLFQPEYLCLGMLPPAAESVKEWGGFGIVAPAIVWQFSARKANISLDSSSTHGKLCDRMYRASRGFAMLYLECEVRKPAGLRENDILAVVWDHTGDREQIEVERNFLVRRRGRYFLPVWAVVQDPVNKLVEVELPQESAGGTNRIWVRAEQVFYQKEETPA